MALLQNVAGLITRLNTSGPLTVIRSYPKEQNETGGWVDGRQVRIKMNPATVHTVNGRDLDATIEADRNVEMIEVYVHQRLFVSDGGRDADRIVYEGRCYRVTNNSNYSPQGNVQIAFATLEEPSTKFEVQG